MSKIDLTCIIDDDPIFIFAAKRILKVSNFCTNFTIFNDGKEAIKHLKPIMEGGENVPDIILLDLNMPIMDGWQFLDEFTKIKPIKPTTLYIVSSSIDPVDLEKAKKYDLVTDYIIKPLSKSKLKQLLQVPDHKA